MTKSSPGSRTEVLIRLDVGPGDAVIDEILDHCRVVVTGPPCRLDDLRFALIAEARKLTAPDVAAWLGQWRRVAVKAKPCPCHAH